MVHDISRELDSFETIRHQTDFDDAEPQIRQLMDDYQSAIREGDLERIFSFYADDLVAYDCPPPLQFKGTDEYKESWNKYFISEMNFPVAYEIQDEKVFAAGELAFVHGLVHTKGTF